MHKKSTSFSTVFAGTARYKTVAQRWSLGCLYGEIILPAPRSLRHTRTIRRRKRAERDDPPARYAPKCSSGKLHHNAAQKRGRALGLAIRRAAHWPLFTFGLLGFPRAERFLMGTRHLHGSVHRAICLHSNALRRGVLPCASLCVSSAFLERSHKPCMSGESFPFPARPS